MYGQGREQKRAALCQKFREQLSCMYLQDAGQATGRTSDRHLLNNERVTGTCSGLLVHKKMVNIWLT